jgi:PAS domain S-box-containing protein
VVEENYRAALEGETRSFEVELEGRMYEVFVAPVETDGDKRMGMALTQDVTEWESTLARLRLSEARLRQAQRLANLGVYQFETGGEGLYWSPEAYRIVGLPESESPLSRDDFLAMILTEDRETVERALADAANLKRRSRFEFRVKRPDGSIAHAQSVAEPALDDDGRLLRVFGAMLDITEQKRTQEEIAQLNRDLGRRADALETANRELEAFSYSVSHDLRSPLRALNGFSDALLEDYRDALDEDGKDMLDRIAAAASKMSDLIDDLLKLSRLSRTELVLEAVNLSAVAESIAEEARQKEPEREINIDVEPDLYVDADARLVRVALANLLGNAVKFTRGKKDACVCVGKEVSGEREEYYVRDNGAGFDSQYAGKLFRPFQRLHSAQEFEGTGIGLATVQRVVQKHGGVIRAVGEPGAGAAFYFTLPRSDRD